LSLSGGAASRIIDGVHPDGADPNDVRSLFNPRQRIEQKRFTEAVTWWLRPGAKRARSTIPIG